MICYLGDMCDVGSQMLEEMEEVEEVEEMEEVEEANLAWERKAPVELSAVLKRLLQLSAPPALPISKVSPQCSPDEVQARADLPLQSGPPG